MYRAHWEDAAFHGCSKDAAHYGERSGSAREGLKMLMTGQEGVDLRLFEPEDWLFLAGNSQPYVGIAARAAEVREAAASANGEGDDGVSTKAAAEREAAAAAIASAAASAAAVVAAAAEEQAATAAAAEELGKLALKESLKATRPDRPDDYDGVCKGGPADARAEAAAKDRNLQVPLFTPAHMDLRRRNDAFYKDFLGNLRAGRPTAPVKA